MGAADNKTLSVTCVGCGKEYPTQRDSNQPQITGFPVRVDGVLRSVPLCRACVDTGLTPEEAVARAANPPPPNEPKEEQPKP
jgi:hypothetical protein